MISISLLTLSACGKTQEDFTTVTVRMTTGAIAPDPVAIKKGQTVCWVNEDSVNRWPASNIHPTHGIYPEFDSKGELGPQERWCFIFKRAGIWTYHDHIFPEIVGTVNVE